MDSISLHLCIYVAAQLSLMSLMYHILLGLKLYFVFMILYLFRLLISFNVFVSFPPFT